MTIFLFFSTDNNDEENNEQSEQMDTTNDNNENHEDIMSDDSDGEVTLNESKEFKVIADHKIRDLSRKIHEIF